MEEVVEELVDAELTLDAELAVDAEIIICGGRGRRIESSKRTEAKLGSFLRYYLVQ